MRYRWTARDYALEALTRVDRNEAFASAAVDRILARAHGLGDEDRALITELTYGVLRYQSRLDRALQPHTRKPLHSAHPAVVRALRLAAYQILMLERIPPAAAVDHAVTATDRALGKRPAGFVNAVLRRLSEQGEPPLPDRASHPRAFLHETLAFPQDLAALMIQRLDLDDAVALAEALNRKPVLTLRANTLKTARPALLDRLRTDPSLTAAVPSDLVPEAIRVEGMADPVRHPRHREGLYAVQQEGSQLVAHFTNPAPDTTILDACCGSGGKTLHLAALTRNRARITAIDVNANRLSEAKARAETAGAENVEWLEMDLTARLPEHMHGAFHTVLLDAPCTGLGALSRHPEAKWRFRAEDPKRMAELQRVLLDRTAEAVTPGGVLVYVVCTFTADEGPNQMAAFSDRHSDFAPADPLNRDNPAQFVLRSAWEMETWPHRHGTEGFYAARLKRT